MGGDGAVYVSQKIHSAAALTAQSGMPTREHKAELNPLSLSLQGLCSTGPEADCSLFFRRPMPNSRPIPTVVLFQPAIPLNSSHTPISHTPSSVIHPHQSSRTQSRRSNNGMRQTLAGAVSGEQCTVYGVQEEQEEQEEQGRSIKAGFFTAAR